MNKKFVAFVIFLLLVWILILLSGCGTLPQASAEQLLATQQTIAERRSEASSMDVHQKAAWFEQDIRERFRFSSVSIIAREAYGEGEIETTIAWLRAMVLKGDEEEVKLTIFALNQMDNVNAGGHDGYLPRRVARGWWVTNDETHANVDAQLLCAYALAWDRFQDPVFIPGTVRNMLQSHGTFIVGRWLNYDFVKHDGQGNEVPESDLTSYSPANHLSILAILEFGQKMGGQIGERAAEKLAAWKMDFQSSLYRLVYRTDFEKKNCPWWVHGFHVPTHSSTWLSFLDLWTCNLMCNREEAFYYAPMISLWRMEEREMNPFWGLSTADVCYEAGCMAATEELELCLLAEWWLEGYPLHHNEIEIVQSIVVGGERPIRGRRIVKSKPVTESERLLPISDRPLSGQLHKRNQWVIDGNWKKARGRDQAPVDYLELYYLWMNRCGG